MQAAKKYRQTPVFRFELKENGLRVFKQFILDEIEEKKQRRRRVA
jgi:polyphosphate kinase 2 (PPK2 family)